uniref:Lipase member I n=2 Tax=Lygus hesperus TaxID=30085 RepID=A0A0A9YUJ4_LYGHE
MLWSVDGLLCFSMCLLVSAVDWDSRIETAKSWMLIREMDRLDERLILDSNPYQTNSVGNLHQWISMKNFTDQFIRRHVKFYIYTRENFLYPDEIWPGNNISLRSSFYDPRKNTTVLIHGFAVDSSSDSVQEIKNKLLEYHDMNVVGVDYGSLMDHWWYNVCSPCGMAVVVLQAPKVGLFVGELVSFLVDSGQLPETVHIVGHSLGAHVAGFAGKYLNGLDRTVARITGLDPSSPGFTKVSNSHRLAPSDASFTDCIFTSAKSISVRRPICQSNFYPNGCGLSQPGCFAGDFASYGGCSHSRAVHLFAESIDPRGVFRTKRCDRMPCVDSNPSATCWSTNETLMGYRANHEVGGIFYTLTNSAAPFYRKY